MLLDTYLKHQLTRSYRDAQPRILGVEPLMRLAGIERIVLASTSLLQAGTPRVSQFFAVQDQTFETKQQALQIAGSMVAKSRNPLLRAIRQSAEESGLPLREIEVEDEDGGMIGKLERTWYVIGDDAAMATHGVELGAASQALMQRLELAGKQLFFLAQRGPKRLMAIIAVGSEPDADSASAIHRLRAMGIRSMLLTGERERVALGIAQAAGIVEVESGLEMDARQRRLGEYLAAHPETAVVCRPADLEIAPIDALAAVVGRAQAGAGLAVGHLAELPEEIERARTLVAQARKVFFFKRI